MGIFFKDKEEKSSKTMIIIRISIVILMAILLVFGIINGFDFIFLRLIFILAGVGSVLDGVEKYLQREKGKGFLIEFGFAILWFILAFVL
jgi:hypothetical protein